MKHNTIAMENLYVSAIMEGKAIELCGGKAFMLPSSIHEVLFTPADDFASLEEMNQMVREVNNAEVEPDIWLSDRAYFVTVDENGKMVVR